LKSNGQKHLYIHKPYTTPDRSHAHAGRSRDEHLLPKCCAQTGWQKFSNISELVENLVHKKVLSRIERGKFCKANFRDENVIVVSWLMMAR